MRLLVKIVFIHILALVIQHLIFGHPVGSAKVLAQNEPSVKQSSGSYSHPGGVAVLSIPKRSDTLPVIKYGLQEPVIVEHSGEWKALIGLDLQTVPGDYLVYVKDNVSETPAYGLRFTVENKFHSIAETSPVSFDFEINSDSLSDIDFSNTEQPKLPFIEPIIGTWSEEFGALVTDTSSSSIDKKPYRLTYTSLATAELSVVKSPSNAIVSKVSFSQDPSGANNLATVYLDHGRGLYSILSGISDLSVETGNGIVAGAVIGKLPSSQQQYSTLVWHCVLNGVFVNPLILTKLNFAR